MRIAVSIFGLLFTVGIVCHVSGAEQNSARPIQIVEPAEHHSFRLELNNLKQILQADEIKNRNVVVVSIAGAFRKGKSFLLNFFIRYLNAKVSYRLVKLKTMKVFF